jgi:hypothetical protein
MNTTTVGGATAVPSTRLESNDGGVIKIRTGKHLVQIDKNDNSRVTVTNDEGHFTDVFGDGNMQFGDTKGSGKNVECAVNSSGDLTLAFDDGGKVILNMATSDRASNEHRVDCVTVIGADKDVVRVTGVNCTSPAAPKVAELKGVGDAANALIKQGNVYRKIEGSSYLRAEQDGKQRFVNQEYVDEVNGTRARMHDGVGEVDLGQYAVNVDGSDGGRVLVRDKRNGHVFKLDADGRVQHGDSKAAGNPIEGQFVVGGDTTFVLDNGAKITARMQPGSSGLTGSRLNSVHIVGADQNYVSFSGLGSGLRMQEQAGVGQYVAKYVPDGNRLFTGRDTSSLLINRDNRWRQANQEDIDKTDLVRSAGSRQKVA